MRGIARAARNVCAIAAIFAINAASIATTTRLYVDGSVSSSGTGTDTWSNAYKYLTEALDFVIANPGGASPEVKYEIWVAAGVYHPDESAAHPTGDNVIAKFYALSPYTKIYGGFAGSETALYQRNVVANTTTLSGNLGAPRLRGESFLPSSR